MLTEWITTSVHVNILVLYRNNYCVYYLWISREMASKSERYKSVFIHLVVQFVNQQLRPFPLHSWWLYVKVGCNLSCTEQYETFLKFNHDQLRRKFDAEMSDCSCENVAHICSCYYFFFVINSQCAGKCTYNFS